MKSILRYFLFVFSLPYGLALHLRHLLYDWSVLKSFEPKITTICIGNLEVGGTGKTPHTAALASLFSKDKKVAILSRGYGRESKGFKWVNASGFANEYGDEPLWYAQNLKNIDVAIDADRANGIKTITKEKPDINLILLDDAMQHRAIKARKTVLLTRYDALFTKDLLLPAGRLRDIPGRSSIADVIIVSKCPMAISEEDKLKVQGELSTYSAAPVFFTSVKYDKWRPLNENLEVSNQKVLLVSAIAHPEPLLTHLRQAGYQIHHLKFSDHHDYSSSDIERIKDQYVNGSYTSVLTTSKDMVKLLPIWASEIPLFELPISIYWHNDLELIQTLLA